jgi:membrane-bound lytic murein transglycosylase B
LLGCCSQHRPFWQHRLRLHLALPIKGQFEAYKQQLAQQAASSGVGQSGLQALQQARLSGITWRFESNPASQSGTRHRSPEQFLTSRFSSVSSFVSGAQQRLRQSAGFFQAIEQRYGVPGSILVAIWGYETNWGGYTGNTPIVSGAVTLASYCRRHPRFEDDAIAALQLVDQGLISGNSRGGPLVNWGTCSFWPATGSGLPWMAIVMAAPTPTMQPTRLQPRQTCCAAMVGSPAVPFADGSANFRVLSAWNDSGNYQRAIAYAAGLIDQ